MQVSEEPTWEAFKLLPNVKYLDFASLASQREHIVPPPLFPRVTHLRLLGQMSWNFLRAFTSALNPSQLISLEFDNLQDFGQMSEGEDLDWSTDLSKLRECEDTEGNPIVRHPGAMRGHLRLLAGKCSGLKSLCLRSVGNDDDRVGRWSPTLDTERYNEWALFIKSVQPTLENLTIEQGLEFDNKSTLHCRPQPLQVGRPMDARFTSTILPVLIEGYWPCLKRMTIMGIGSRPRQVVKSFLPTESTTATHMKDQLAASAQLRNVLLEVREVATKTFFYRISEPTYDS